MKRRNGYRIGESHHRATLTDEQVSEIRSAHIPYVCSYGVLAKKYGVGESTIRDIVKYRTRNDA